jgi:hypothetical protein
MVVTEDYYFTLTPVVHCLIKKSAPFLNLMLNFRKLRNFTHLNPYFYSHHAIPSAVCLKTTLDEVFLKINNRIRYR